MDEYFYLYLLLGVGFLVILFSFQRNFLIYMEKQRKNEHYIAKARIKRKFDEEDEEDENDVKAPIKLPSWAYHLAEGMGIDIDALMSGDEEEVEKVKPLIEKFLKNKDAGKVSNMILD